MYTQVRVVCFFLSFFVGRPPLKSWQHTTQILPVLIQYYSRLLYLEISTQKPCECIFFFLDKRENFVSLLKGYCEDAYGMSRLSFLSQQSGAASVLVSGRQICLC